GVEGVGRGDGGGDDVALVELELHGAGDVLLGVGGEGGEGLPQGGEPLAVVDQVGEVHRQLGLHVGGVLVDGDHLQHLVGPVEDGAAGGLVHAPVFHAGHTVF